MKNNFDKGTLNIFRAFWLFIALLTWLWVRDFNLGMEWLYFILIVTTVVWLLPVIINLKGGVKMPRIFRYLIYSMIVILLWKLVTNIEVIITFLADKLF